MRPLIAVLLLGCAADPDGPSKTTSAPIPTTLSPFERLHDAAGVVAGMPAFRIVHRVDPNHCGGLAVEPERTEALVPATDAPLADVLAIRFPSRLDFREPHKAAALKRFDAWVQDMSKRGAEARTAYSDRMMAKSATLHDRVVAAARIVQMQRHLASTLVRAEIPLDVRDGEFAGDKTFAFCERIGEVAEAIMLAGEGAAKVCAEHAAGIAPGWWTRVCVLRRTVTASVVPSTSP